MNDTADRKYGFFWDLLGNLDEGRPNLGYTTRVEVYRLMQFCFRDILEQDYGAEKADELFYRAGFLAGTHFYNNVIGEVTDLGVFVRKLQDALKDMSIGVLRVEEEDLANGKLTLTVSEDLDCSGLPELSYEVCTYDEGFIAALLESFSGKKFHVKEVDCWCTGDRTCRFRATVVADAVAA
ncbi:MAG: 4-vinyl reductase [Gammaproteobacteria bacterium]|nr:4-vinyl reductase [Gammaproteobacteria bacterium]MBU1414138.1 4-vinyl reductase [Gammaproteobacteria bacterium]